jgi:Uma2 family endonuclease
MDVVARGREPDLLFISSERLHLLRHTFLDGAADVAIEIVSPESIGRDRGDKFVEYERAGVREYWLIDPDRRSAEFYELGDDSRYHTAATGEDGIYRSKVITGFWLRVDWLWQTPLPQAIEILRELKVV